jgi:4-amino-4-deoxy-L-arabinose transferase-like glycosyltransferase
VGRRAGPAAKGAAVVVGIGFVAAEAIVLTARVRDFDEGVYWQSIRALTRGEPLFRSVFAPQPPAFYYTLFPFYLVAHSLTSLRIAVLVFGVIGLAAVYLVGRLLAGEFGGLVASVLAATSPLYLHQSAIVQADGPAVAISIAALALALLAVRETGLWRDALAAACGLALALSVGIKLLGVVAVVPVAIVLLGAARGRGRLVAAAVAGGVIGLIVVLLPALASPGAAFDDLVLSHLRAGQGQGSFGANLKLVVLRRDLPLELLGLAGALLALRRRDRSVVPPLAWVIVALLAVLFYQPLFPHHLVMLTPPLALLAAVGLAPHLIVPRGRREALTTLGVTAVVLAVGIAGAYVVARDTGPVLAPDLHNLEMTAAVRVMGQPEDFWISDNPYAVAAADRDIPGPLVDTSGQRIRAGLLTVRDLEAARARYHVRWVLVDSFRLDSVPGFRDWLGAHFHPVRTLGGRAVIYGAKSTT